jgi:hypothetical protein
MRPLPEDIARWSGRARWLRRFDAVAAWALAWAAIAVALPELDPVPQAVGAAVLVGVLGLVAPLRLRWRPVSGAAGLWLSRALTPGARAWHLRPDAPELVIVTARRGLRVTVAVPGRGAAEGLSVRRTRVLLLEADRPERRQGVFGTGH